MPSIAKPIVTHPSLEKNELGLNLRAYEGAMSTLCAGCGHDSVTAAIIKAAWKLSIEPYNLAKFSGIGCSSKTPTYFVSGAVTFVARSFSGEKEQLVPIIEAAFKHKGLALIDVISPCVTFNDHEGSTKSYLHTRKHEFHVTDSDVIFPADELIANISRNGHTAVTMHDGSVIHFTRTPDGYDPRDR